MRRGSSWGGLRVVTRGCRRLRSRWLRVGRGGGFFEVDGGGRSMYVAHRREVTCRTEGRTQGFGSRIGASGGEACIVYSQRDRLDQLNWENRYLRAACGLKYKFLIMITIEKLVLAIRALGRLYTTDELRCVTEDHLHVIIFIKLF